jgi:multidrug resistance efflux pump
MDNGQIIIHYPLSIIHSSLFWMEEYDKIELRHEDVQEILGTPPSWIVRWGITVILLGVGVLFWVGWVVKYPDIIRAQVQVTTETPPVPVVARTTGYLSKLAVKDGDFVSKDTILVILQSTANYVNVLELDERLHILDSLSPSVIDRFQPSVGLNLGDIQPSYSAFVQTLKEFQFKKEANFSAKTVNQLDAQIRNLERQIQGEKDKYVVAETSLKATKKRFLEKQDLYTKSVISRNELEDASKDILKVNVDIANIKSEIDRLNGSILQIKRGILDVQQTTQASSATNYASLIEAIYQVKTSINRWKQSYLLTAPMSGKVSFFNDYWAQNQNIKEGDNVMAIVPTDGKGIVGLVSIPLSISGKVLENQRVVMKFDSYNYQDWGVVSGVVGSKALVPNAQKMLSVRVNLTNGLVTSYGKTLTFDQQMLGSAEIISEDKRFVERVFNKLISAFRNN